MLFVVSIFACSIIILLLSHCLFLIKLSKLKASGIYPKIESSATNDDVRMLLRRGYRLAAIRLYRVINKKNLIDTVREIDRL